MPVPEDYQAEILRECGDPNGTLATIVPTIWALLADKGLLSMPLQALYAKRSALDIRLAEEQPSIDFTIGQDVTDKQSERFDHLQSMRDDCQAEIVRVETLLLQQRGPVVGVLTTVEPQTPPCGGPDSNWSRYRGSPYYGRNREW